MIEDAHERTRAILWMLADIDPEMPIIQALGYLKAIEAELEHHPAGPSRAEALARAYGLHSEVLGLLDRSAPGEAARVIQRETGEPWGTCTAVVREIYRSS